TGLSSVDEASCSSTCTNIASNNDAVPHVPQELSEEDERYAAANLNETDETKENAVAEIKRWIEDELRIRIDDFFILRFLRVCKFNLEKTKMRIQNYYKLQSTLPEWFKNRDPFRPELQELLDLGICLPLRKPDSQGRLVVIIRSNLHDPRRYQISDIFKMSLIAMEVAIKYYPAASVYGCVMLIDVANPTLQHIFQLQPYILMNIVHSWQSCYPMRFQKINIFNVPTFFNVVVNILKSFMTEKIKNRFHTYSHSLDDCFKDISAEILPIEYDGTDGTIQELKDYWKKLIEENCGWLKNDNDRIE
ncbi:retinol-binding protein pinta-like, partial [Temnothorax curvispinosus]|uniref:Retinol-binding protein pinta-like n=1 Tax=Temnothorax curvispinosus TaxID=300111 RepID=A0A6J1QDZ3_9HYME